MPLSDLTARDAVLKAISEYEEKGAEAFLTEHGFSDARYLYLVVDGKRYPSKAIAAVAYGYQYPNRPTLKQEHGAYSGGESTVAKKLRSLGFDVIDARAETNTRPLSRVLEETLDLLARRKTDDVEGALRSIVSKDGPKAVAPYLPNGCVSKGRAGMGTAADVPWIGIFPEDQASAQSGYYLVYLFAADGSRAYLALAHATEQIRGFPNYIKKRTLDLRNAGGPHHDLEIPVDLASKNARPKAYEYSAAYAIRYDRGAVPDDAHLARDMDRLDGIRRTIGATGLKLEDEPIHMILKWSAALDAETVSKHRAIADSKGAVWWGGFGSRPVGKTRMAYLRKQLEEGQTTFAFLYGGGQVWRTTVVAASNDAAEVEDDLLLPDRSKGDAAYFFKLKDFEQIEQNYLFANAVLARDPDPERMPGALGNQATPLFIRIRFIPETGVLPPKPPRPLSFTMEWLELQTNWPASDLEEIIGAIRERSPQVVLAGPPGTGKTWLAKHIATYLTQSEPGAVRTVQLHPSYGYEEFVEGLRPVLNAGAVDFQVVPGVVRQLAEDVQDEEQLRVLIIDEMNRANLPLVFGELMYLFEYRNEPVNLRYTANFELPGNLRFIGTMNTADRSIRAIDIALRRRFDVYELAPDPKVLERFYARHQNDVPDLIDGFVKLNGQLETQLDRHHGIGHSFFMRDHFTFGDLDRAWKHKIGPLIEEYFFDEPDIAATFSLGSFWSEP